MVKGIIIVSILILIHEMGHLILAKKRGVAVDVFSVGFGPLIFKKAYRGTTYGLGVFPIGGYVGINEEKLINESSFSSQIAILTAGGGFNLLVGFLCLAFASLYSEGDFLKGIKEGIYLLQTVLVLLGKLLTGGVSSEILHGPIGVFKAVSQKAGTFYDTLRICGILSLEFAVINLLPIPGLDGGHIVIAVFEKLRKRKLSERSRLVYRATGNLLVFGILVALVIKDIWR